MILMYISILFPHKMLNLYFSERSVKKRNKDDEKRPEIRSDICRYLSFFLPADAKQYKTANGDEIKLIWFTNNVYKFDFIENNLFDHFINLSVFQSIPVHRNI